MSRLGGSGSLEGQRRHVNSDDPTRITERQREEPEMSVVQRFNGLKEEVREGFGEKIVALRREIHREPELGFDTKKTAEKVLSALDGLPLDIQTGVAENGIVATLFSSEGPTVGLRADMDALPIHEETGLPFASEIT